MDSEVWESEFHELNRDGVSVDILAHPIVVEYFKELLILLRIKKRAKIKRSKTPNSDRIQVECPYCRSISIEEELTRNYFCLSCHRKSYIDTSSGLSSHPCKAYNIPRSQRKNLKKHRIV